MEAISQIHWPTTGPERPLIKDIIYVWAHTGAFATAQLPLKTISKLFTARKQSCSAAWASEWFGDDNETIRWLNCVDQYVVPNGVDRFVRMYLGNLTVEALDGHKIFVQKHIIITLAAHLLLCRNGSYIINFYFRECFESPLGPVDIVRLACIGHPKLSFAWTGAHGNGALLPKNTCGSMADIAREISTRIKGQLAPWQRNYPVSSFPSFTYTMTAISDTYPKIANINEFVKEHEVVLAAVANMDIFGLETRSEQAIDQCFHLNLSVDKGLGIYPGEHSLLVVQAPADYPPWIPHFESLNLYPQSNKNMLLGILHNYNVFVELALCETATVAKFVELYTYLSERGALRHHTFQGIKLAVSRELESLRNYPTQLSHGLQVISIVRRQQQTDELLQRLERHRALLEEMSCERYQTAQNRMQLTLNILVLSALGMQIAAIIVKHYQFQPDARPWLLWQLVGASLGPIVLGFAALLYIVKQLIRFQRKTRAILPHLQLLILFCCRFLCILLSNIKSTTKNFLLKCHMVSGKGYKTVKLFISRLINRTHNAIKRIRSNSSDTQDPEARN